MKHHIWVKPSEACEKTGLTPAEICELREEYGLDFKSDASGYYVDLMELCYLLKTSANLKHLSLFKDNSPIPPEAFDTM